MSTSTMAAVANSHPRDHLRSRSSSTTGFTSPESQSSDSFSSSDPDTRLSFLNSGTGAKSLFGMEVEVPNSHTTDMEPDVSFDAGLELGHTGVHTQPGMNAFQDYRAGSDDMVIGSLSNINTSTKDDMLMLEEVIEDCAFESSSNVGPPFHSYPSRSPAFRDIFIPPPFFLSHHSHPQPQPDPVGIDPSSTQHIPQPHVPATAQAPLTSTSPSPVKADASSVPTLFPTAPTGATTPHKSDPPSSHSLLPYDSVPSTFLSREVVHPPKDVCVDLPIFFPSIPVEGTKSRVETQIKLTFELGFPISASSADCSRRGGAESSSSHQASSCSSASNSPITSPVLSKREILYSREDHFWLPTHNKVGTYRFLRLPHGTATKRRPTGTTGTRGALGRSSEVKAEDTLEMSAEVVCCSSPHALVQSCPSCQCREAKRTARKLAARVRPPPSSRSKVKTKKSGKKRKEHHSDSAEHGEAETEEEEEPNADASIIQFNCTDIVDFCEGTAVLPMRITCYCRHHKEKVGFNIIFTLRDHLGRVIGRGTTPPILITDDHKSNNAVSKLPPMHPLRQAFNPPLLSSASLPGPDRSEEVKIQQEQGSGRIFAKRHDGDSSGKKRRPKPYDGRPLNRTAGVGPGIEGRRGVVLALHPAHAKAQLAVVKGSASAPTNMSSRATTASPGAESAASSNQRAGSFHSPVRAEKPLSSPTSLHEGISTPQGGVNASIFGYSVRSSHRAGQTGPFIPTDPPSPPFLPSSSSSQSDRQAAQSPMISFSDLQSLSSEQQAFSHLSTSLYPSLGSTSFPKIHRLIPSSGPTTGGIEITVLGSNFHSSIPLECVFGGAVAGSTHRWSDNTLVCVLPPRAVPGIVGVNFKGIKEDNKAENDGACLFNYVDESDRQLMELALQVVGLKMTGKIEEARSVAMRIVGNTNPPIPAMTENDVPQMNALTGAQFAHHSFLGSLSGVDLETLIIKLLTLLDVPPEDGVTGTLASCVIGLQNATGQTLLHLAAILALPALVSCLAQRSIDLDARNSNGLTALHFAALTGWKEGVEILLAAGADAAIVDQMGFTPADRARSAQYEDLRNLLGELVERDRVSDCRSGEEGDDEGWHDENEVSEDDGSDVDSPPATAHVQYAVRSHITPPAHINLSPEEPSESQDQKRKNTPAQAKMAQSDVSALRTPSNEKHSADGKQEPSFVGRLQRNLPQGILPNMQIPQLQLPGVLAGPWGALPHIPVFPVFVPMPKNLPHLRHWPALPWTDPEKKESSSAGEQEVKEEQQPPFAMLWAAYDNIANNAWRAHWEKWTAQVTALHHANAPPAELPPMYTPRQQGKQSEAGSQMTGTSEGDIGPSASTGACIPDMPGISSSRIPTPKATRRAGYRSLNVPDTEVDSYHYQPKNKSNQKRPYACIVLDSHSFNWSGVCSLYHSARRDCKCVKNYQAAPASPAPPR